MYKERILRVQEYLKNKNIDAYIAFSSDYHGSEYIVSFFKTRAFLSGFTGSAGTLLITQNDAYLWTDGRYFLQAEMQLKQSGTHLMRMGEDETIFSFIQAKKITSLLFDFKVATLNFYQTLQKECHVKCVDDDPSILKSIWLNRPELPKSKAYSIPTRFAGESIESKLTKIRENIKENHASYALLTSLDDIAWTFNLRGDDILYNPVNLAYAIIGLKDTTLFIDKKKVSKKVALELENVGVILQEYKMIYEVAESLEGKVLFDTTKTNLKLANSLKEKESQVPFITTTLKAIKNDVEIKNMKKAHIKDAVAMIKFMYYLKSNVGKAEMSEISLSDFLESLRREQGAFTLSFDTICGYKEHGAIVHYSATEESNKSILKDGLLLVDSGGQYKYGTTDITRTFALGNLTEEMKHDFTLVLKSHIDLAMAQFKYGTTDIEIDVVARKAMKKEKKDFNHGTGHGVGYMLNVHEGPQSIRKTKAQPTILEPGMITSNEPGYYVENQYGIRHENLILCKRKANHKCCFETITLVPFDLDGILVDMLTSKERKWLNSYHKMINKKVSKYLSSQEQTYLMHATREI